MLRYRIDILSALKARGYNTTRIRREGILGQATLTRIRQGLPPDPQTLDTLCRLLGRQPGSLLEWIPDDADLPDR